MYFYFYHVCNLIHTFCMTYQIIWLVWNKSIKALKSLEWMNKMLWNFTFQLIIDKFIETSHGFMYLIWHLKDSRQVSDQVVSISYSNNQIYFTNFCIYFYIFKLTFTNSKFSSLVLSRVPSVLFAWLKAAATANSKALRHKYPYKQFNILKYSDYWFPFQIYFNCLKCDL